jgi:DNA (cytosine-5)-methyltransferase 1
MGKTIKAADLFCGAGGASVGFRRACKHLGLTTDLLAINHWLVAVETHRKMHPESVHLCESVERVDPRMKVFVDPISGREFKHNGRLQILIAAPECTHHSTARGGRPINDQTRATAFQILKWPQEIYIDNILIENVPEFEQWGPVGADGRPLKSKRGHTFRAFISALESFDYYVDWRVLNAADYGDPTTRKRLFIMARKKRLGPIKWPEPTHSRSGSPDLFGSMKKWRAAREVIDWDIKGQSIFGRKRQLSPKTIARIMAGLERFGGDDLKPFLVVLKGGTAGHVNASAKSLDKPMPTLCAKGQHVCLVQPEPFIVPLTHGGGTDRAHSVEEPVPTITGAHRGELAVVQSFVLGQQSGSTPRRTDEPIPTIATDGAIALVEPFMISAGWPKVDARLVSEPMNTVLTRDHMALVEAEVVEPFIVPPRGFSQDDKKVDSVDDPLRTIVAASGHTFAVVEPFLVPHYGERQGQDPRIHSVDEPVPTIPASGDGKFEVCQPEFIASYYGTQNISPVTAPLPTITARDRFALVMPVVNGKALDIRLRMLKPHELAAAMSFDRDYEFTGTQGDKVKQIGNAWACGVGQALIQTLLAPYAVRKVKSNAKRLNAIGRSVA